MLDFFFVFFFQAEDGIRDLTVTGVQTCALPISRVVRPAADRCAKAPTAGPSHRAPARILPATRQPRNRGRSGEKALSLRKSTRLPLPVARGRTLPAPKLSGPLLQQRP